MINKLETVMNVEKRIVLLASGFEEIETLTIVDLLR